MDLSAGPSVIEDRAHLMVVPAYHVAHHDLYLSLEAPARIQLADLRLRSADFDEFADYGRVLRTFRVKDTLEIGALKNFSDAHGLVISHFFNQIDDAHHRTAVISRLQFESFDGIFFADQVLGPPILGTLVHYGPNRRVDLNLTVVSDTQRPRLKAGKAGVYSAGAIGALFELWRRNNRQWSLSAAIAQTHLKGTGGHLGVDATIRPFTGWDLQLSFDGMSFTQDYVWAPFDLMYLFRRNTTTAAQIGATRAGFGGRARLVLTRRQVAVGIESVLRRARVRAHRECAAAADAHVAARVVRH